MRNQKIASPLYNMSDEEILIEVQQRYPDATGYLAEAIMLLEGYVAIHKEIIDKSEHGCEIKCPHCGSKLKD